MELVNHTSYHTKQRTKIPVSFGPNGLISTALPNSGNDSGAFMEVRLENLHNQPQLRPFTISTVEIFNKAQREVAKSYPEPVSQKTTTAISRAYRGAILELVESLESEASSEPSEAAMLYSHLDCVWHFCEIMFISSHPDLPVLPYYMDWIKQNFDDTESSLTRLIPELPELDSEGMDLLWRVIFKYTLHGRTKEAAKLLEFLNLDNSAVLGDQLSLMSELLIRKPEFKPTESSLTEYNMKWQSWKMQCENQLNNLAFCGNDELTLLVQILAGRDEGLSEGKRFVTSWHEYLCMLLNYQFPLIRPSSLKAYALKAIDDYGEFSIVLTPLDKILLAAMDFDIVSVLKDMQSHWNHPWFPLHFADLVFTGGVYSNIADTRIDYKAVGPIRNDLIREYGNQMMTHPTLWEVGVKYLEAIPNKRGHLVISQLLQRKKPHSEYEAEKIIRVAKKFDLQKLINGICRQLALEKYNEGQLQNSLLWAIRAEDSQMTATVIDRILESGNVDIVPALVELTPKFTACGDRLLFLNGYCDFTKLIQIGRFKEAVELFCRLIEQNLIPNSMKAQMFLSFYEMASANNINLDPVEVSILMQFLHTKVGQETLGVDLFLRLNEFLMANRVMDMLTQFKHSKKITRGTANIPKASKSSGDF